jgi:PST family polysaccharide transporter
MLRSHRASTIRNILAQAAKPSRLNDMSTPESESLLTMSTRGVAWGLSTQFLGQLLHLGLRIILARLLAPEDFGLVAMVVVFLSFAENILDLGFGAALVQRRELTHDHRTTVFWCVALASCCAALLFVVGAPAVGKFYGSEEVVPIVRVLGISLVLGFPDAVYRATFQRDMDFRTLGVRRIASTLIGGLASMWMILKASWRPGGKISWLAVTQLWRYSRSLVGARLVNYFNRNLDNLLVGKFLGAQSLGIYSFAYQGVAGPLQYLARPLANVAFPAFAKVQRDKAVARRAYLETLSGLAVVCIPVVGVLCFFSPWIIPWVLGAKWMRIVIPFQLLCVVASIQVMMSLSPPLFNGLGRPDLSFKWTLIALGLNAVGFITGLQWGVTGVAAGYTVAVVASTPAHFLLVARLLDTGPRSISSILVRILAVFLVAGLGLLATDQLSLGARTDGHWIVPLIIGVAASVGLSAVLIPNGWKLILRSVRSIGR